MKGFDPKFADPPAYILGVTHEIWEERGVETLHGYYAPDIPVRSPSGVVVGNEAVIAATYATLDEFPDRQLFGEDVIWSDDGAGGFLSSHRILSTATHQGDGAYGAASGTKLTYRIIADCAARENTIYDEWLVRDQGAIVRQLGLDPKRYAAGRIEAAGGPEAVGAPFTPATDVVGEYRGRGNDDERGVRYEAVLQRLMAGDDAVVEAEYDRAVELELPGLRTGHSWVDARAFWGDLRAAFPTAEFEVHHRIGRVDDHRPPRAAIRWSLTGTHDGAGERFGPATGAPVHVMAISHAEFGPWGLRREFVLFDETAIWTQILLHTG